MNVDVIINGGGIVGASFALQLQGSGLQAAVIEPKPPPNVPLDGDYDHRVYAITPANMALLDDLDVFQPQDRARLTPIRDMKISGDRKATLDFSAHSANRSELATMVEHRLLATRLQQRLSVAGHVRVISHTGSKSVEVGPKDVKIRLDDDTELTAALLVGADGGDSWVRGESGFAVREKDYDQVALVANFSCERAHGFVARQWFANLGVMAWLPLGERVISIVWSVPAERGQALIDLEPHAFCLEVNAAGENALGEMTLASPVARFPLRSLRSETMVKPRIALMGDAAHVIHPLAGQGLNLGVQDAEALAHILANRAAPEGVGDLAILRRYERARAESIAAMHGVTDGLQWLFASQSKFVSVLRDGGLGLVNKLPSLKKMLIGRAIS